MASTAALFLAASLVGILHMSAPDHWTTITMLGKSQRWGHGRLLKTGLITGIGHVALSIMLGIAIVSFGLLLPKAVFNYTTYAIGLIMLAAGSGYAIKSLLRKERFDLKRSEAEMLKKGVGYFAVLGAALSPDLSVLPIFLVAIPAGINLIVGIVAVFAISSIATLLALVYLGHILVEHSRFSKRIARLDPRYNDALVGIVIAIVGIYIVLFG